jgi:hypothetical protein
MKSEVPKQESFINEDMMLQSSQVRDENKLALWEAFIVFFSLRVALSLVAAVTTAQIPEQTGQHVTYHRSDNSLVDVWVRWDSEYYLDMAQFGYNANIRPELPAFFPLYPWSVALASPLLFNDYTWAGIIISNLAFFLALFYLFKLAAFEFGKDTRIARRSILYMAIYPAAFFLLAVYPDSLFLAASIAAFYYARSARVNGDAAAPTRWLYAGIAVILAGLTYPMGIVLAAPLALEAWNQWKKTGLKSLSMALAHVFVVFAALFTGAGWILYVGLQRKDILLFFHTRESAPFFRTFSWPWDPFLNAFGLLFKNDPSPTPWERINTLLDLLAIFLLTAAIIWWFMRRKETDKNDAVYSLYCATLLLFLLVSTVPGWPLQSLLRYSLAAFPVFLMLAKEEAKVHWKERLHSPIVIVSSTLLGILTALFAAWYWVL